MESYALWVEQTYYIPNSDAGGDCDLNLNVSMVYLNDIIIFSTATEEHLKCLGKIMQQLQRIGLKHNPYKLSILVILYLLMTLNVFWANQWSAYLEDTHQCEEGAMIPGFAGFYRKFVKDFANIEKPLHQLTGTHIVKKNHIQFSILITRLQLLIMTYQYYVVSFMDFVMVWVSFCGRNKVV